MVGEGCAAPRLPFAVTTLLPPHDRPQGRLQQRVCANLERVSLSPSWSRRRSSVGISCSSEPIRASRTAPGNPLAFAVGNEPAALQLAPVWLASQRAFDSLATIA